VEALPVKVLPKTNSFGGTSSLGVVVFVMDNLEGSMSRGFIVDADSTLMLYSLVDSRAATSLERAHLKRATCGRNWRSILTIR
jgi:hypothetical protein